MVNSTIATGPASGARGRPIRLVEAGLSLESASVAETALYRRWLSDPMVTRPLGRQPGDPGEGAVLDFILRFDLRLSHLFTIRRESDRQPLGFATAALNAANRLAWIDIVVGGPRRPLGDTQEVLAGTADCLARWIFESLGLDKICVQVAEDNRRTVQWLTRRMTLEGRFVEDVLRPDGTRATMLRFGILRREWPQYLAWRDSQGTSPRQMASHFTPTRPAWSTTQEAPSSG